MAQVFPRFCPRCGAPTMTGHPVCANCGLDIAARLRMQQAGGNFSPPSPMPTQVNAPAEAPFAPWNTQPPPSTAAPKKRAFGRVGCILLVLLLLIVAAGGYVGAGLLGYHLPGFAGKTTQAVITTTPVNTTVTYAGVNITILNVQQSDNFIDDPNSSTAGMVRLHLQEQNKTAGIVSWSYYDAAHLLVPKQPLATASYVKAKIGIAPGVTQTSIVDFAVPSGTNIRQLTLRLGTANEAQMDVPLTGQADMSQYMPKTTNLNGQMSYFGLNWTLTGVTSSYYIDGQQAAKIMRFITVSLKVDSTLAQQAITGPAFDYIRLKSGNVTATPQSSTLPVSFDAGETGKTGTVTFLMPQDSTAFTLILLAQKQHGFDQATTDFQLS